MESDGKLHDQPLMVLVGFAAGMFLLQLIAHVGGIDYLLFGGFLGLLIVSFVVGYILTTNAATLGGGLGLSYPAGYLIRVLMETRHDPSASDLWFLTLLSCGIAAYPVLLCSKVGASANRRLLAWHLNKPTQATIIIVVILLSILFSLILFYVIETLYLKQSKPF